MSLIEGLQAQVYELSSAVQRVRADVAVLRADVDELKRRVTGPLSTTAAKPATRSTASAPAASPTGATGGKTGS